MEQESSLNQEALPNSNYQSIFAEAMRVKLDENRKALQAAGKQPFELA